MPFRKKKLDKTGIEMGDWDEVILNDADETAVRVICNLRDGVFWPATYPAPKYSEEFAAICLDNVRGQPKLSDDAEGGAA